ncbi:sperm-specific protein Don juan-like [Drosophila ficusphila]|uniref:sperm-specific protein Don juan-like n=1 Tax=Drosophila ficusphila TaxID=30025 RepID=UPI001C88EF9B|nr:sperm-specific protein Don juan-like [Drosophila ficusphila]
MFKSSAIVLSQCAKDSFCNRCIQPTLVRSHHLKVLGNLDYEIRKPDDLADQRPKRFGDGSFGVIRVQESESSSLANPMHRQFLDDLEQQQVQRLGANRWLKEEKHEDLEQMKKLCQKLATQITMLAGKGKGDDAKCKEQAQKDKCAKDALKKKCDEMAKKEKCEKEQMKKKCDEMKKKEKGGGCKGKGKDSEKDKCKKMAEEEKKKKEQEKCKKMAEQEKCKKMADEEKKEKEQEKCKKMAEQEKCKKMAEKDKCKKK